MSRQERHATRRAPQVIELAGPAGSGKTTLNRLLNETDDRFVQAPVPGNWQCIKRLPAVGFRLLASRWSTRSDSDRSISWAETRSMLYLVGWLQALASRDDLGQIAVIDHGPAFRLASLREFGPEAFRQTPLLPWWEQTMAAWSQTLDLVVWLDAPNETLFRRIQQRKQKHVCKTWDRDQAYAYLDRYRQALDDVLVAMRRQGGVRVMRFDSVENSPEWIVESVRAHWANSDPRDMSEHVEPKIVRVER